MHLFSALFRTVLGHLFIRYADNKYAKILKFGRSPGGHLKDTVILYKNSGFN